MPELISEQGNPGFLEALVRLGIESLARRAGSDDERTRLVGFLEGPFAGAARARANALLWVALELSCSAEGVGIAFGDGLSLSLAADIPSSLRLTLGRLLPDVASELALLRLHGTLALANHHELAGPSNLEELASACASALSKQDCPTLLRWLSEQRHLELLIVVLSVILWAESAALTEVSEPKSSVLLPTRLNRALVELCAALSAQPNPDLLRCARPSAPPPRIDEDVQFTVYKPKRLSPGRWDKFLAFAHLGRNPTDAPPGTPSPEQRVREQAAALLGPELGHFDQRVEDAASAVPREGRLTFLPAFEGLEFEPPYCTFVWLGEIHRAEFQVRALPEQAGRTVRGQLRVLYGGLILAELNLSLSVAASGESWSLEALEHGGSARAYRKIFASYSHGDRHIVDQVTAYATSTGDRYLVDHVELRAGEKWSQALERMIDEADIFQLFWSRRSMQSAFVRREWEYALSLGRPEFVRPTYWETPFPEAPDLPPAPLKELHFACIALPRRTLPAPVAADPVDPRGMLGSLAGLATASAALLLTLRTGSLNEHTSAAEHLTRAAAKVLEVREPRVEPTKPDEAARQAVEPPPAAVQGVPELNAHGASTALFLVLAVWAIWSDRRRRAPHADRPRSAGTIHRS
jgi:hypothetical protein